MKRYIRLNDNTIVDLIKLKEMFNKNRYTLYEDDKLIGIFDTLDECLVEYFYKYEIIAESDSVFGLGGYAYFEDIKGNIHIIDDIAFDFNRNEWCFSVKNVAFFENEIAKLYTKQGDNYILVWDKERGVI